MQLCSEPTVQKHALCPLTGHLQAWRDKVISLYEQNQKREQSAWHAASFCNKMATTLRAKKTSEEEEKFRTKEQLEL